MRLVLHTNVLSPHQFPLATCLNKRIDGFRYVATEELSEDRRQLGWNIGEDGDNWVLYLQRGAQAAYEARQWLENSEIVLTSIRDFGLMERRVKSGKLTFYMSERWFKPPLGKMRLFHPRYFLMATRIARLMYSPWFYYLPMGRYAGDDMMWLMSLLGKGQNVHDKQRLWGYFVDKDKSPEKVDVKLQDDAFRVLWFGRLLKLKCVDTLIHAVAKMCSQTSPPVKLKIIGAGPEEEALRALAIKLNICHRVEFTPPVPIKRIRDEIRHADVCVVTSNGQEGWGVAVNEIMLEGRCAIVSKETGAGRTMIRDGENGLLFRSGDVDGLAQQLQQVRMDAVLRKRLGAVGRETLLSVWMPEIAAERLMVFSGAILSRQGSPKWDSGPLSSIQA